MTPIQTANAGKAPQRRWYKVDLHLHTPASHDYEEPHISYLEWMRAVAAKGLDIVAITDHNTVAGIAAIRREIEWLTKLETMNRLTDEEQARLAEWRELSNQVLVLPGFEFTATFGFHILGLFPPETSIRHLEHILLSLNVPAEKLDIGSTETGAATDVLNAYRIIHQAGGLVIAAHANSTHGVAMRNFPFGGQTKIAYTQDVNLDALEVTDLDRGYRSTARFFDGSKTEYPRRMHSFAGSDAHRIKADPKNPKRLGIGDRASEFLLEEPSFEAIVALLRDKQFERTRPFHAEPEAVDTLAAAREEGPSLTQSFHESASQRGGKLTAIVNDICAFANTAGGVVYVGAGPRKTKPRGLPKPAEVQQEIMASLDERMTPPLEIKWEIIQSQGVKILRFQIPKGTDRPYCVDDYKYYVRDEGETTLAVRDELVALVREALTGQGEARSPQEQPRGRNGRAVSHKAESSRRGRGRNSRGGERSAFSATIAPNGDANKPVVFNPTELATVDEDEVDVADISSEPAAKGGAEDAFYLPQIGVEIVATEDRNGNKFHSIHDLRNGHVIHNVTRKGARKLWSYAIQQHEDNSSAPSNIEWQGNMGLVGIERRAGKVRYDLALRADGKIRIFYGVTEDGMEGPWSIFVQDE
ncbi:MAG: putative DNA binding domain-containing protein [Caldilineaceae bacterium]|nr:putative DNA binding domain-containing protein [Caldilineaceae bacterium]